MNLRIAAYRDACEALARPFTGRAGAEADDLVQEGLIFVWQSLERGEEPSSEMIQNRMKNWCRTVTRQRSGDIEVSLDALMKAEDYDPAEHEAEL